MIELESRYYQTFPVDNPRGHTSERLTLDPARTVFLLVDVYGIGFDPGYRNIDIPEFYRGQVERSREIVVEHIVPAEKAAKSAGIPIVYLTNYLSPTLNERSEWRNLSLRVHGIDVLKAWQEPNQILAYSDIIAPCSGEHVVKKQLYSGFYEIVAPQRRCLQPHNSGFRQPHLSCNDGAGRNVPQLQGRRPPRLRRNSRRSNRLRPSRR